MSSPPPAPSGAPPSSPLPPQLQPHRCHPRLADWVESLIACEWRESSARFSVLHACYASERGAEPSAEAAPFRVDPSARAIKLRQPLTPSASKVAAAAALTSAAEAAEAFSKR